MQKKSLHILLVLTAIFISGFRPPENLKEVSEIMEKLSKANAQKKHIAYDLTYKLFIEGSTANPSTTLAGLLIQSNGIKYSQMGEVESLKTPKYFISIDREEKILMISNNNGKDNQVFNMEDIKIYLTLCKKYDIKKMSTNQSKLSMELKAGELSLFEIFYNHTNFAVEKISMTYNKDTENLDDNEAVNRRLEISFKEIINFKPDDFRLKLATYCVFKNGEWKASSKFSKFEFINNLYKK